MHFLIWALPAQGFLPHPCPHEVIRKEKKYPALRPCSILAGGVRVMGKWQVFEKLTC